MKIILLKDVKDQGRAGDLISVSDGYARNFLLKNKLAKEATASAVNEFEQHKKSEEHRKQVEREEYVKLAGRLNDFTLMMSVKCGETGKIFGSIMSTHIAADLARAGFDVDKKKIVLPEPIKNAGNYIVDIRLYPEISAKLKVKVEKK
ncbi:MAG: 50S ribosomal protein L9 [Firmicutes bacterium]|nr:50S ribosomal protein L9 [Bacillota bacterium]